MGVTKPLDEGLAFRIRMVKPFTRRPPPACWCYHGTCCLLTPPPDLNQHGKAGDIFDSTVSSTAAKMTDLEPHHQLEKGGTCTRLKKQHFRSTNLCAKELGIGLTPVPRVAAPRSPHHHSVRTLLEAGKCLQREEERKKYHGPGGRKRKTLFCRSPNTKKDKPTYYYINVTVSDGTKLEYDLVLSIVRGLVFRHASRGRGSMVVASGSERAPASESCTCGSPCHVDFKAKVANLARSQTHHQQLKSPSLSRLSRGRRFCNNDDNNSRR